ncbi:MAG: quinoprotein relay system zinc metallohydrolase 2 [Acetobacteraceae bacterium]
MMAPIPSRRTLLFGGCCLCCLPPSARAAAAAGPLAIREVAPGIHIRRGVDQEMSGSNRDAIANIGFIVGRDAVLVTDSGGSLADGEQLRATISTCTDRPIRYVVMSHVHPDHAFGADAFRQDNPVFIGHHRLAAALGTRGAFYRRRLAELIGADRAGSVVMPTEEIRTRAEIDLGGRVVSFYAHGPAHTDCDLSLLDHRSGLLLPADLLFVKRMPSLDGSLLGWLHELEVLGAMGATRAVPGHGPVAVDWAPAASALRRYLTLLRDETRDAVRRGVGIDQAVKTVARSEAGDWVLFDDYNGWNVTEAYRELEWE